MKFFLYDNCRGGDMIAMMALYEIEPRRIGIAYEVEYIPTQLGRRKSIFIFLWHKYRRFSWIAPETTLYNRIRGRLKKLYE